MTLAPGTKLGPYEILSSIGAGGMGEVWSSLGTIVGIISGAVVTYFFARQSIDVLKRELYKERYARTHSGSYPPES